MGKKKVHHEEHVDETWLIPYADMLTLLLALFIVMFAMSKTDTEKLKKVSDQFSVIFSSGSSVLEGDSSSMANIEPSYATKNAVEEDKMSQIKYSLEEKLNKSGYSDRIKVEINKEGLGISIQDGVLFKSGDSNILEEFKPLLSQISQMLSGMENNIKVSGHTDNVPINTPKFRSNWDLSASRSISVMHFMVDSGELNPKKMSIEAYGEYNPKYNNSSDEGRAKNRRVEILVLRKYPSNSK